MGIRERGDHAALGGKVEKEKCEQEEKLSAYCGAKVKEVYVECKSTQTLIY